MITQKIIYYVSLFSEDVSEHLQKIRSKKVLFSTNMDTQKQEDLFILDLDEIDSGFVNLILDVLEYYELFRLCLMLCNRYHMSERLGRYLVSVCSKYSNLHLHRFNVKVLRTQNALNDLWLSKQRMASIIAHEALHNVFELVEPNFMAIKKFREPLTPSNSLGMDTYRTMLDLGFWKKLVYIGLESSTALQLCCKFLDKTNFELLSEFLDDKDAAVLTRWREQLALTDYWLTVYSHVRETEDKALALTTANKLHDSARSERETAEFGKVFEDLAVVHRWMYLP